MENSRGDSDIWKIFLERKGYFMSSWNIDVEDETFALSESLKDAESEAFYVYHACWWWHYHHSCVWMYDRETGSGPWNPLTL